MNETAEEKAITEVEPAVAVEPAAAEEEKASEEKKAAEKEKKSEEEKNSVDKWQKWALLIFAVVAMFLAASSLTVLLRLYNPLRLFLLILWLLAALCFGMAALSAWNDEKKWQAEHENGDNRRA